MQHAIGLPPMPLFSTGPPLTLTASTSEFSSSTAPPPAKRRRRTLATAYNQEAYDKPAHEHVCNGIHGTTHLPCTNAASPSKDGRYLPTCKTHKHLRIRAGHCRYQLDPLLDTRCGRLFRWLPPHFELCLEHVSLPQEPCHLFNLPPELRFMIFRYLLPKGPYDSAEFSETDNGATTMSLLLTNRQVSTEVRSLLYSEEPFVIDISEQGVYMLGRSLYAPRDAFGKPRSSPPPSYPSARNPSGTRVAQLQNFSYSSMRQCIVKISMFNRGQCPNHNSHVNTINGRCFCCNDWDEEVELYDLRDIVYATLGILKVAAAGSMHSLAIQVTINDYPTAKQEEALEIVKTLTEPFATNLRDLKTVKLLPPIRGIDPALWHGGLNAPRTYPAPSLRWTTKHKRCLTCVSHRRDSLPLIRDPILFRELESYTKQWEHAISRKDPLPPQWPIRSMFSWLKKFYIAVDSCVKVSDRRGRDCLLHRARVARENNNVGAFHLVRDELIAAWTMHVDAQRKKEKEMEEALCYMLDADTYVLQGTSPGSTWMGEATGTSSSSQPAVSADRAHHGTSPDDVPAPVQTQGASSPPQDTSPTKFDAVHDSSSSFSSNQQGVSRQIQAQKQRILQHYAQAQAMFSASTQPQASSGAAMGMLPQQPVSAEHLRQQHVRNLQQQQRAFQAACRARIYHQQTQAVTSTTTPMPSWTRPPPGSVPPYHPQMALQPCMQSDMMPMRPCVQPHAFCPSPDIVADPAGVTEDELVREPQVKTESSEFRMDDFVQDPIPA